MWNDDPPLTWRRGAFLVSTDRTLLDVAAMHDFLANHSYWAADIPLDVLQRAIAGSLCFGLYDDGRQVGFARAVTDWAPFSSNASSPTLPCEGFAGSSSSPATPTGCTAASASPTLPIPGATWRFGTPTCTVPQ
jgi:hypothetical protein